MKIEPINPLVPGFHRILRDLKLLGTKPIEQTFLKAFFHTLPEPKK
jgi:hypothetical protein